MASLNNTSEQETPGHSIVKRSRKLDLATVGGLGIAVLGIIGGLLLEGGHLSDITQLTAALIVIGGTVGAVMITTPVPTLLAAVKKLPSVFWQPDHSAQDTVALLIALSAKARRKGIVSLETEMDQMDDPFLQKALGLLIDGTDLKVVRRIMELEIESAEHTGEAAAKVFEAAGGYAPTIGIIGAVLGLIQVMKHLDDIEAVGHGIAVAFVATVYGVALSNIFLLPAANKLKARLHVATSMRELALEGVIAVGEGLNSQLIGLKLEPFLNAVGETPQPKSERKRDSKNAVAA